MDRMIKYFDQIKADDDLKEKTKSYIREIVAENKLNADLSGNLSSAKKRQYAWKKLSLAALSAAACMLLLMGGYTYYMTPVNYVSLDINPSMEIGLNRLNRVVETEGINEEGAELLSRSKIINLSADEGVKNLILLAKARKYIRDDGSTVIAVTALSEQAETALKIRDQVSDALQSLTSDGILNAVIYSDCADLQIRSQAKKSGVSSGKYKLILLLNSLDSKIEIEQYLNTNITDIIVEANELLLQNRYAGSGLYEQNYEKVRAAAEQIQENTKNVYRELNIEQEQNQKGDDNRTDVLNQNINPLPQESDAQSQGQGQDQSQGQGQDQSQGQSQDQSQGQNRETESPVIDQEQTNQTNQNPMINQPEEGSGQSGKQEPPAENGQGDTSTTSSDEKGGKNSSKKNPN